MTVSYPKKLPMHIDGEWLETGSRDTHMVINPATGETIAQLPLATKDDLDRALEASETGFAEWRARDVNERGAILRQVAQNLRERVKDIAPLLTMEQGKPLREAMGEILGSAGLFEWFAEEAKRSYGRVLVRQPGQRSVVLGQPVGPVAAFSPWNFPLFLMARKLAPALAAGCSIICKPPEETPACAVALMQCVIDAGVPGNVAQLVFGVPDMVSSHLIASPIIRKVSFTGSVPVGKHLIKLCADTVKRHTMELGGHAPVLVFDDCDLDRTLDIIQPQKFRNAGQVCVSPTRFYVQSGIYNRFVDEFTKRTEAMQVGSGMDDASQIGPLANIRRPDAIEQLVSDARDKGARVTTGGDRIGNEGFFFRPTVLADVPLEAQIMNNEPFGPVAMMRPFDTFDEAIEQANRLPFGLAAFAFSENGRQANKLGDMIEAGMVGINTVGISGVDTPFGGMKQSGYGSEDAIEGLEAYLVTKAVHQA
ncbi:NAD-dependent succinate-semialdehyde dehydrogenase [Sphingorhabdus sp. Alg239-R122]|uniref:NAD-dependent succinate-semialdehyde dehydrogenase n=1 Tax=Sphingorhabdus sp. Alg239-R122 TaxID=2305989 RepID=UPI0013DBF045|nr:NAD-dependent succinate-semialdehyde dehydrogenase [Sphingorhabdus sp. Alg239-R122]